MELYYAANVVSTLKLFSFHSVFVGSFEITVNKINKLSVQKSPKPLLIECSFPAIFTANYGYIYICLKTNGQIVYLLLMTTTILADYNISEVDRFLHQNVNDEETLSL